MRFGGPLGCQHENSSLYKKLMGVGRISQACLCLAGFGKSQRLMVVQSYGHLDGGCQMPGGNLLSVPSSVFFNRQKEISLCQVPPS